MALPICQLYFRANTHDDAAVSHRIAYGTDEPPIAQDDDSLTRVIQSDEIAYAFSKRVVTAGGEPNKARCGRAQRSRLLRIRHPAQLARLPRKLVSDIVELQLGAAEWQGDSAHESARLAQQKGTLSPEIA
ncbi:hypothetical protein GCM10022419_112700 [Nonomuraea rosea]|uniref:Uncharacterized protein n=1 Tax=Nonomuraea rosea TaxID=638574 RepID=A0ABP6ZGM5_9ACTN